MRDTTRELNRLRRLEQAAEVWFYSVGQMRNPISGERNLSDRIADALISEAGRKP